jgi:hypothetical protein
VMESSQYFAFACFKASSKSSPSGYKEVLLGNPVKTALPAFENKNVCLSNTSSITHYSRTNSGLYNA